MSTWHPHRLAPTALLLLSAGVVCTSETAHARLKISEFSASPDQSMADSDGDYPDWIEVENTGAAPLAAAGYSLSDDADVPGKWVFPAVELGAGETVVVFASGKDRAEPAGELHTNFSLTSSSGYLALFEPGGEEVATAFRYPKQFYGLSYGEGGYFAVPSPGEPNGAVDYGDFVRDTKFSVDRGFFDAAFDVEITTATEGAEIYTTTDGSEPSESNGVRYTGPIAIDTTTVLRAVATKPGWVSSGVDTQTYVFPGDVIHQPAAPVGVPATWGINNSTQGPSNNQPRRADYEMDPDIIEEFGAQAVVDALLNHPTISIVMDPDDLWNESQVAGVGGLYPNPYGGTGDQFLRGWGEPREWEKPCSVEFIGFEKVPGKQVDCGVRMAGNYARHPNRYKHHLRLVSRREYGDAKFRAPLFSRTDVDTFDDLILRGGNSESWTFPVNAGTRSTVQYFRDQYYKDMQVAMGHLSANQEYFHLYLNGLYWGFYTLIERVDAHWMSQHLGGEEADYDVVKQNNVVQDGDREAWEAMYQISRGGMADAASYAAIQEYLNLDNLIDYLLFNFWAGTVDWRNNWRAGRRRAPGEGFMFFNWDGERGLGDRGGNREFTFDATGTNRSWPYHPNELHHDLRSNAEYRIRFADRVQKHLFNDGVLTEENAMAAYNARAEEVRPSLVAESARWGDRNRPLLPYTTRNEWGDMLDWMNRVFFPRRNRTVYRQLQRTGVYPLTDAPEFNQFGGQVAGGFPVLISAPDGAIYFTTDGSDPRLVGGELNPVAMTVEAGVPGVVVTEPVTVRARALRDGEWSAMTEATFTTGEPASSGNLVISEIYYNPAGPGEEGEFIELMNIGEGTISLAGVRFDQGIDYAFPPTATLEPGARLVLRGSEYEGRLANGGENVRLVANDGSAIREFRYDDRAPWPAASDGGGRSLVLVAPYSNPDHSAALSWMPSAKDGGTPAGDDLRPPPGGGDLVAFFLGGEPVRVRADSGRAVISVPRDLQAGGGKVEVETSSDLQHWEAGATFEGFESSAMVWSVEADDGARVYVRVRVTSAGR